MPIEHHVADDKIVHCIIDVITPVVMSELQPYVIMIDENTTLGKTYFGKARESDEDQPLWQIKCIDETTDVVKFLFADGEKTFTKKWDKREEYTYE